MMHSGLLRAVQVYACVLDIIIASMFYHILLNDMLVMTYGFDSWPELYWVEIRIWIQIFSGISLSYVILTHLL